MCFDGPTLSAYADSELDREKQSEIEEHLLVCDTCRTKVSEIKKLSNIIGTRVPPETDFAGTNVWTRIVHSTSASRSLGFWHRGFVLPSSVIVAVSSAFIILAGVSVFLAMPHRDNIPYIAKGTEATFYYDDIPIDFSADKLETILDYFEINDEPVEVFIQLPEASDFSIQGEPRFLLKTEYVAGQ